MPASPGPATAVSLPAVGSSTPAEGAIADVRAGRLVVVAGSSEPGARCCLAVAAEHATPTVVNFLVTHARGLLFLCLTPERARELGLGPMGSADAAGEARMLVSIEAREGVTTGVSAADRSHTFRTVADPRTRAVDLIRPGHVFPFETASGGVLERAEPAEAAVDLARLAGLQPAAVICDVMRADGTLAALPDLAALADRFRLGIVRVPDLVEHRHATEKLVERTAETVLSTSYGSMRAVAYRETPSGREHLAIVTDGASADGTLLSTHSECLLCDVFGSRTCSCGQNLGRTLGDLAAAGGGVLVYTRTRAGTLPVLPQPRDGEDRDWAVAQILADLGVRCIRMLPGDSEGRRTRLERYGVTVVERASRPHPAREQVSAVG